MPCYSPIDAYMRYDGITHKNIIEFTTKNLKYPLKWYTLIKIPCGRCIGCRLERSRQWASRIMCESQIHEKNSFLTLTYAENPISLVKRDCQLFLKRLRKKLDNEIRFYLCGEYGEQTHRPHYHCCLFGEDFSFDRIEFRRTPSGILYYSQFLTDTWALGHTLIGNLDFESASYVARYCTKKITGPSAESHYAGREPEFALMSRRPGIGAPWLEKFSADVYPSDELIIRGRPTRPPRFFDQKFSGADPEGFAIIKSNRVKPDGEGDMRLARRQEYTERTFASKSAIKEVQL